jgi:hypothetical protein
MAVGAVGGVAVFAMANGCLLQTSDADKFREPLPQTGDSALSVPGSQAKGGTSTQSAGGIRIQDNGGGGNYAVFYSFTRDVADGVDLTTGVILGAIIAVTSTQPTTIDAHQATWGPGQGNALDPITWRLTVTEVGDREFDYHLDGRPHLSTSDADFKAILTGHGWGKAHANHRSGWFQWDNDVYRSLDPARGHDTGTVKVTFDARTYPIVIEAVAKPTDPNAGWFDVTVTHNQDASGEVDIKALGDIDTPKDGVNENVVLHSRWDKTGAGRADVQLSGGDLKQTALASECWADTFVRTYYTDNVNYKPTCGNASLCVFPQAQFSQ